jgi:hypothetical protein
MGVPVELPKKTLSAEDIARRQRDAELREQAADRDSNVVWDEIKTALRDARPAALVVDPPDGRIPLTREGQQRVDDWGPTHYGLGISSWVDLDLWDRCITKGFPTVMIPMGYANAFRILQTRDSVAILFEIIHDVRIIPLDKRPHVGSSIRQYWGDSRGHWEGNTLVVEVTNFSDKTSGTQQPAGAYRGGGREQRIVERFTRLDGDVLEYRATIEDPKLFTRPFTLRIPMAKNDTYKMYEYACHEGNYGLPNILSAAKAAGYPAPRPAKR